jgi:hypothetical protein
MEENVGTVTAVLAGWRPALDTAVGAKRRAGKADILLKAEVSSAVSSQLSAKHQFESESRELHVFMLR